MAHPRLEVPDFAGPGFGVIRDGLRVGYNEGEQGAIKRIGWHANLNIGIATRDTQQDRFAARMAKAADPARKLRLEEGERIARDEADRVRRDADKKKPKMNSFIPGSSVADVLPHPHEIPSQYALQKLSTFDFVELWYFSLAGCIDAAKPQVDDTFGLSRVDDHLTVQSIVSVRASRNALQDHELSFSEFLRAKHYFLKYARKADWPADNLDALAKFFWYLEIHPSRQLLLGEQIILTYASRVRLDWHNELKAGRGYDISVINDRLMNTITNEVRALHTEQMTAKASKYPLPFPSPCRSNFPFPVCDEPHSPRVLTRYLPPGMAPCTSSHHRPIIDMTLRTTSGHTPPHTQMLDAIERVEPPSGSKRQRRRRPHRPRSERRNRGRDPRSRSRSPGPLRGCHTEDGRAASPCNQRQRDYSCPRSRSPERSPNKDSKCKASRSVCPSCLGRFPHNVRNCDKKELWDGSSARCSRNPNGFLTNPQGQTVCTNWQRPFGCQVGHSAIHECSGCGSANHGAQTCDRAQKI